MKNPLSQLLLLSVFTGFGLWVGVKWFLDGSQDISASIDVRSQGHLREVSATGSQPGRSESDPASSVVGKEQADGAEGTSDEKPIETVALGAEELSLRDRARKQRLAELGLISEKLPEPTVAVDVSLIMPDECANAAVARVPVGLKFRYESANIRGESLNALESLISLYRDCEQGEFVVDENPLGRADASNTLKQMRFDEVKYFFIQHSVSIDTVSFPEQQ